MVVKVKEGSLWHKTDIGDVIEKEKTLLNEIKLYKSNKNRGRQNENEQETEMVIDININYFNFHIS